MTPRLSALVLSLFFLGISFAPVTIDAQPMQKSGGILFSNIAPGESVSEDLKKLPLKVAFSSDSGIIYGGVFVRIFNASGNAIFKALCEKPWLFVQLPMGDYHVVGVDRNKITRIKEVHLSGEGSKQVVLNLTWPKQAVGY